MIKIGINGFGRIGRNVFRVLREKIKQGCSINGVAVTYH